MGQIAVFAIVFGFMQFLGALGLNHAAPLIVPKFQEEEKRVRLRDTLSSQFVQ
jgi:hypothetical protein